MSFIGLTNGQKNKVLEARNHPDVRKMMFNKKEITFEEHSIFLNELYDDLDRQYFAIMEDDNLIGVISYTQIDWENRTAMFGIYSNLINKVQHSGNKLMAASDLVSNILSIKYINLKVDEKNFRAISIYEKWNFHKTGEELINGIRYLNYMKTIK